MKSNYTWLWIVCLVVVLLAGMGIGKYFFPNTVIKNVPGDCKVCDACVCPDCPVENASICVYNSDTCGVNTVTVKDKVCPGEGSPSDQLKKAYINDTEVLKHSRVQNLFVSCDSFRDRETKAGRLVNDCWNGKRTIVETKTTGTNRCAVLTTSGC